MSLDADRRLRIALFGQPLLCAGDKPIALRAKSLQLLAYVVLHRDRPVDRNALAFALWEDETEEVARTNLRRHLHQLVHALPPADLPWLAIDNDNVAWNAPAGAWVDIVEFERLLAAKDTAGAVALYRGDLYETAYDDWLFAPRERLRNHYLHALSQLVLECRSARRFAEAIDYGGRILTVDPWREDVLRALAALRYESGDRAGAIAMLDAFARRLRADLAVDPMPETVALREAIVGNRPLPTGTPAAAAPSSQNAPEQLPFAGRDRELERLMAAWNRAARGSGAIAFVGGEPGIGKSRLVAEFAARVESEGARVLSGSTSYPEASPYQPLADALRGALGLVAALRIRPQWLAAVAQIVPELGERRADLPPIEPLDGERERIRLHEALSATLAGLAQPRPVLLILEDVHWAGAATVGALEAIARRVGDRHVLVVATYRPQEAAPALRTLRRTLQAQALSHHVALGRLDAAAVIEIVRASRTAGSEELARGLHAASDGNPLFLGELLRDFTETGERIPAAGTLANVVAARVGRLDDDARTVLEIASVVGPAFDIDVLREVSAWDERTVSILLDQLFARGLVREAGRRTGFDYVFSHDLVRTAIYEDIPADLRRARHRRAAIALASTSRAASDEVAGDVARHFELGGEQGRAVEFYVRAARHAASLRADAETAAALERVFSLGAPEHTEIEALLLREEIESRRAERSAQAATLARLDELSASGDDEETRRRILERRALYHRSLDDRDGEGEAIAALRRLAKTAQSEAALARIDTLDAAFLLASMRKDEAAEAAARALAVHRRNVDFTGMVENIVLLGTVASDRGALEAARDHFDEAAALAGESGDPRLVARVAMTASANALIRQDFERCCELAKAARDAFEAIGDREGEADAEARLATALTRLNRFAEARHANAAAAAAYEAIGRRRGYAIANMNLGLITSRTGNLRDAEAPYERAYAVFTAIDDARGKAASLINLSCLALLEGRAADAKALALQSLSFSRSAQHRAYEASSLANLGAAERDLGELDAAIEHMRDGLRLQADLNRESDRVNDLADLALAQARRGDLAGAAASLDAIRPAIPGALDGCLWPHNVAWSAAQVAHAIGRDNEAQAILADVRRLLAEKVAGFADDGERERFAELPVNRAIAEAVAGRWPAAVDAVGTPGR